MPYPGVRIASIALYGETTTGCGISGGMVHDGVIGKILVHRLEGLKGLLPHLHGPRTALIPLSVETTTICGTNGGTVPAGATGRILVHHVEACVHHRAWFHGDRTGWTHLPEEEMIICGISGMRNVWNHPCEDQGWFFKIH